MKLTAVSVACLLCSTVLFPLFAIGGIVALFLTAVGIEGLQFLRGEAARRIDHAAARATAMRICHGRMSH